MIAPPRLVLDTNVVVSALLWRGKPGRFLTLAADRKVRLYTSRVLIDELGETLGRPKFANRICRTGLSVADMNTGYRSLTTLTKPAPLEQAYSRDPDDDHVIACAISARADAIVSGDDDLLSMRIASGIGIQTAAEALGWLEGLGVAMPSEGATSA